VRKVRTASGATVVQIASKSGGVRRIVEHLGSAHDEAELEVLLEAGRGEDRRLAGPGAAGPGVPESLHRDALKLIQRASWCISGK